MLHRAFSLGLLLLVLSFYLPRDSAAESADAPQVTVDWTKELTTSRSTPTLQVVVNPPLRRGTAIHYTVFAALRDLGAEHVRYVPWLPYPDKLQGVGINYRGSGVFDITMVLHKTKTPDPFART